MQTPNCEFNFVVLVFLFFLTIFFFGCSHWQLPLIIIVLHAIAAAQGRTKWNGKNNSFFFSFSSFFVFWSFWSIETVCVRLCLRTRVKNDRVDAADTREEMKNVSFHRVWDGVAFRIRFCRAIIFSKVFRLIFCFISLFLFWNLFFFGVSNSFDKQIKVINIIQFRWLFDRMIQCILSSLSQHHSVRFHDIKRTHNWSSSSSSSPSSSFAGFLLSSWTCTRSKSQPKWKRVCARSSFSCFLNRSMDGWQNKTTNTHDVECALACARAWTTCKSHESKTRKITMCTSERRHLQTVYGYFVFVVFRLLHFRSTFFFCSCCSAVVLFSFSFFLVTLHCQQHQQQSQFCRFIECNFPLDLVLRDECNFMFVFFRVRFICRNHERNSDSVNPISTAQRQKNVCIACSSLMHCKLNAKQNFLHFQRAKIDVYFLFGA